MNKILILFGHPAFKRSTINAALRKAVETLDGIRFHDLYASYPDFLIDVDLIFISKGMFESAKKVG